MCVNTQNVCMLRQLKKLWEGNSEEAFTFKNKQNHLSPFYLKASGRETRTNVWQLYGNESEIIL